jgi:hypothetical protein
MNMQTVFDVTIVTAENGRRVARTAAFRNMEEVRWFLREELARRGARIDRRARTWRDLLDELEEAPGVYGVAVERNEVAQDVPVAYRYG